MGDRTIAIASIKLARCLFYLTCIILFSIPAFLYIAPQLIGKPIWLEENQRLLLLVLCLISPLSFVYCHWLLEQRSPLAQLDLTFSMKSMIAMGLLMCPALLVVVRIHVPDWASAVIAYSSLGAVVGLSGVVGEIPYLRVLLHAREVMLTRWHFDAAIPHLDFFGKIATPPINSISIARIRKEHYFQKHRIAAFQKTLSCPLNDALTSADLLTPILRGRFIKMLDFGGGEGAFARNLLDELSSRSIYVTDLRMCDPVDWKVEYTENISSLARPPTLTVDNYHSVPEAIKNEKFDLIVASHSLYALLDGSTEATANVIDQLLGAVKPGGALLVILSSNSSHAYSFKDLTLKWLFGTDPKDTVAEDLENGGRSAPSRTYFAKAEVDNLADLTQYIGEFGAGNHRKLRDWISYFLRIDVDSLDHETKCELENFLLCKTMKFSSTPLCLQQRHSSGKAVVLNSSSLVLPHRTTVMIWKA